ncbi:MAG: ROK family transcriptional regulator [Planctomycetota bacterium]
MTQASIVQPRLLSKINERLVLDTIQRQGPSTRAEITECIGVTFATVAKAVSSLLEARLLEEFDEPALGRGRPAKRLRLAVDRSQVVGVAMEVDEVSVVAAGLDATRRGSVVTFATPSTYEELIAAVSEAINDTASAGKPKTLGVGVSVAAQVDESAGRVAVAANLPYLTGKPLRDDLAAALGVRCSIVRDTHAVSVAERLRGGSDDLDNFLLIHMGVGIGMGVMIDGRPFFGQHGYAGELGHMTVVPGGAPCHCGRKGCLETVASGWGLTERLSGQLGRVVTIDDIAALYSAGDPITKKEMRRACKHLGLAVSHSIHLFNPARVIVYSRLFDASPELMQLLVHNVEKATLPLNYKGCEFVRATTTPLDGSIAHIIDDLADSLAPRLSQHNGVA